MVGVRCARWRGRTSRDGLPEGLQEQGKARQGEGPINLD
jgi:hypothetical protein